MKCYDTYRRMLLDFSPAPADIVKGFGWPLLLSESLKNDWKIGGVRVFDLWSEDKSKVHKRRIQKEIAALRPEVHRIDWNEMLPENTLPPVYEPNRRRFRR